MRGTRSLALAFCLASLFWAQLPALAGPADALGATERPDGHAGPGAAVITDWSVRTSQLATATGMPTLRSPITLALVHLAMYDAVNAIDRGASPYVVHPPVRRPASPEAAAVEAAYQVLLVEFPSQQSVLDAAREQSLSGLDEPARSNGIAVGAAVARQLLELRAADARNDVVPYTPGSGPGVWVPTPPGFLPAAGTFLARVVPFTMRRPSQFRPDGPPALRSHRYAADYNEVKSLGQKDSATRTPEQTATATFWEPLAGTVWPASIRRVSAERGLDLPTAARFQAAAFAAFADSLIACWDAKYHFNFWRPVTAIQQGDADGNRHTAGDPAWEPLFVTPNFPDYTSGHCCATAAVAYVMEDFFPHDLVIPARNIRTGEERFYSRARDVVDEVVEGRMLMGIHFRTADEDGADIGRRVARRIRSRYFKPRGE